MTRKHRFTKVLSVPEIQECQKLLLIQLVEARLELNIDQQQAADFLKLPVRYIQAIESGQFERLPGRTFVRGYLRAYTNYLGLPVAIITQLLEGYVDERDSRPRPLLRITTQLKPSDPIVRIASYSIAILCLVLSMGWWSSHQRTTVSSVRGNLDSIEITKTSFSRYNLKQEARDDIPLSSSSWVRNTAVF